MKISIDRIENGVVVAELANGQTVSVPSLLFPDAVEGDIFIIEKDSTEAETRRNRIADKMNKLFID